MTEIFTPRTVIRVICCPNKNTKIAIVTPWVIALLNINIMPSKGCVLVTVKGVNVSALWWNLWNSQRKGILWSAEWTIKRDQSSIRKKVIVNNVAAIQKETSLYIPSLKKLCMCNSSKTAVATTILVTKRGLKKLSNILLIRKHFKSRRLDLLS